MTRFFTTLALAALSTSAVAADSPGLWAKTSIGSGAFPTGAISDTRLQYRAPLHRSDSIVFQDTYAGIGARVAVSPAFTDVGVRASLAPIDVFDLDVQASMVGYYPTSFGPQGFDAPKNKLASQREGGDTFSTTALVVGAMPTFKIGFGPFVAFSSWTVQRWQFRRPDGESQEMLYEPFTDTVMGFTELFVEHQAAAILKVLPGDDGAKLWVGATARDRQTFNAGDRSTVAGGLAVFRPGAKPESAQFVLQVLPYLTDADRVGLSPNVQGQVSWTWD